jgi:hypothetical protein
MQQTGGSVTANAGTNLNTSALALETTQAAFKSANHTDLGAIVTALGTPLQAGGTVTVANPSTNYALETGGNLAAINTAQGTIADAAATDSTSSWSVIALLKGLWAKLSTINTTLGTPLQAGGAVSISGTVPVTGAFGNAVASAFTPSVVSLTAATATLIVAMNTLRVNALIYNNTGAVMYVGNVSVGITGMPVPAGSYFFYDDTAALYGYSVLGGNVNVFDEET